MFQTIQIGQCIKANELRQMSMDRKGNAACGRRQD